MVWHGKVKDKVNGEVEVEVEVEVGPGMVGSGMVRVARRGKAG